MIPTMQYLHSFVVIDNVALLSEWSGGVVFMETVQLPLIGFFD